MIKPFEEMRENIFEHVKKASLESCFTRFITPRQFHGMENWFCYCFVIFSHSLRLYIGASLAASRFLSLAVPFFWCAGWLDAVDAGSREGPLDGGAVPAAGGCRLGRQDQCESLSLFFLEWRIMTGVAWDGGCGRFM